MTDCIDAYVESIRKGKTICAAPIIIMVITAVVGGLFSLMGGVVRVIALLAVAVCWIFAIREIIKIRKEAREKAAEAMKCKTPVEWRRKYEVEAERAYLKQYNKMVEPVYSFTAAHPA